MIDVTERLRAALAGRYMLQRELGRGGMATVYLAEDSKHHRPVAIKVLDPELAAVLGAERFLGEIEIAARLQHPHILPLLDSGAAEGLVYYVMPYVQGESLRDRLTRERQLPADEALKLTRDVAGALDFAHAQGVVHRDIKPENILLSAGQAVLADFGIARAIDAAGGRKLTETGTTLGTPSYMSPEQVVGSKELDGRSDLYGLACVLYEMLAGQPPFTGPTAESIIHQHLAARPPPVTALRPAVPEHVERALTKALAKTPADRFVTASQFVDALSSVSTLPAPDPAVTRRAVLPGRRIMAVASGVILVFAALAIAGWKGLGPLSPLLGSHGPVDASKKDLILVAEFEGPADNPGLADAAHDLLSTALDQSEIVATVPDGELRTALKQAGKPDTIRIDAALARELAYRRSIRAVVEGRITRVGKGYSIALRVVDVDSSRTVLSLSEMAASDDALIPSISRIARKLRTRLGENRSAIRSDRPLVVVLTPSFEAYRKYLQAREQVNEELDNQAAIATYREALALDPDFAQAMKGMGIAFANLNQVDSAKAAFAKALRHPDRLTDYARLDIDANTAKLKKDLPAAMSAYDRLIHQNVTPWQASTAYNNRAIVLMDAGRFEEAIESYKRAIELAPFQPKQIHITNLAQAFYAAGHLDETRKTLAAIKSPRNRQSLDLYVASSASDWARAESLGSALQEDVTADIWLRRNGAITAASGEAAQWKVRAAETRLRRAQAMCGSTANEPNEGIGIWPWGDEIFLAMVTGHAMPPFYSIGAADSSVSLTINRGVWAAASGDTNQARRILRSLRNRPKTDDDRVWTALIEGWVAAKTSRWHDVVRLLSAMAESDTKPASFNMETVRPPMRWLVADANDHLGKPDSAAVMLELIVKTRTDDAAIERGICYSFAQHRLVMLYARMGRLEDARRHWEILSATVTNPDPDMVPRMEEARAALASSEGMARSARR